MKINHHHHYHAEESAFKTVAEGLCALIQLYATELNFYELLKDIDPKTVNWEYLELVLMTQLEQHPESAAQEANYEYFEVLKETIETLKKDNQ